MKKNEAIPTKDLSAECITILTIVAKSNRQVSVQDISNQIDFSLQKIQNCVDHLIENKFLDRYQHVSKPDLFLLSSRGREYLFSKNLLNWYEHGRNKEDGIVKTSESFPHSFESHCADSTFPHSHF